MDGTLVFDGECGFCTRSRDLLARLDRHGRVRTAAYQQPDVPRRFGVDRAELARSVYWFGSDGTRGSAAAAINSALSAALGTRLPLRIYRLPGVGRIEEAVYRWISANRHRLPGTTPWCRSHPDRCRG